MIRKVRKDDALVISRLITEELGYPMSVDVIEKRIEELSKTAEHYIYVFEDEKAGTVGFVEAGKYDSLLTAKPWLNILGLAVDSKHKRCGMGQQLISKIESIGKELDYEGIRLNSAESREGAHRFYESMGYDGNKKQLRFFKKLK